MVNTKASQPSKSIKVKTANDNPVVIEGYNVFGKSAQDKSLLGFLFNLTEDGIQNTRDASNVRVGFQIGRITSISQDRRIVLPVETDVVLESDTSKIQFVPNVSTEDLNTLYISVFGNTSSHLKFYPDLDNVEIEITYSPVVMKTENKQLEGFHHSRIYIMPYNADEGLKLDSIKICKSRNLGSLLIYKQQSHYHLRFNVNTVFEDVEISDCNILGIKFRSVRIYKCKCENDFKTGNFQMEVITEWSIRVQNDITNISYESLFKYFIETLLTQNNEMSNGTVVPEWIDIETVEETRQQWVQMTTYDDQLSKQYNRMLQSKGNRFHYILSIMYINMNELIDAFNSRNPELDAMDQFYYPGRFGDVSENAQIHYDTRKLLRQQGSAIEALRRCNNFVKRILISFYIKPKSCVLDLACGHGQDLDKFGTVGIQTLVGIDISKKEILEARSRYNTRRNRFRFSAEFHHGNVLDKKVYVFLKNRLFDVVNFQLAIHYVLESEQMAEFIITQIHKTLNDGGLFIGSTMCCKALAAGIHYSLTQEDSTLSFGNDIFTVTLDPNTCTFDEQKPSLNTLQNKFETDWGIKYHFYLMESINESEYVVPWTSFVKLCRKVGLRLVETCTFPEWLQASRTRYKSASIPRYVEENLEKHYGMISGYPLSHPQQQVFQLYKIFVFEKISARYKMFMGGVKIMKH
ncbi:bifunctional mRNA (guanine-N(7))-methyltransferase domain/S-adenosyl-L-methionine-dependent methyltransferase superfamily/mRNA triphosphatase Cet1-like superfamily/mRNA cap guanine-N7 methyltransferase/mRNA triphosphatase Cet1-like [Babesia duncani]|uniref:mRNA (guanine-N(7))-methyltransferase n=1 Tax=Babesia duncani TaxID=323732 RepID=A0AAD9PKM4_9APIC|nr:bifunctional mRNA (guanine-N(7))-methyltransferase domain/S-adenosyl-L-methionine-dependent methyltransferase superfamily/mRNA triphosphatase Cet1-like superfamily/mRNA cap guanine-N7 methyltransferase/mRNA triphosphatase Cet1-like [Babesia duncani]